jgi:hypothetical protein
MKYINVAQLVVTIVMTGATIFSGFALLEFKKVLNELNEVQVCQHRLEVKLYSFESGQIQLNRSYEKRLNKLEDNCVK